MWQPKKYVSTIKDTLADFVIQEPLPVPNLGTVFWSVGYSSIPADQRLIDSYPSFKHYLCSVESTDHYSIPHISCGSGGLTLDIRIPAPLREDVFEMVDIDIDWVMRTIERKYAKNCEKVKIEDLAIPHVLVTCLEDLLREWQGKDMQIYYVNTPGVVDDHDPTLIWAQFSDCQNLPDISTDDFLRLIVERLTAAFAEASAPVPV